jgi:hypothetical protein
MILDHIKRKLRAFAEWLLFKCPQNQLEIVLSLVLNTASLELKPWDSVELAPIKGCCGPFKLYGNSLPVITYRVFEKAIMEFILVRVEIARPDRITYLAKIDSVTAPERHGESVEVKPKYKEPFQKLALQLFRYFPLYKTIKVNEGETLK